MKKVHHSILPDFSHDEISRGLFIKHFSIHIEKDIYSRIYSSKLNMLPNKISKKNDLYKLRKQLLKKVGYKFWSSLKRINQELLFDNLGETIFRQTVVPRAAAERTNSGVNDMISFRIIRWRLQYHAN